MLRFHTQTGGVTLTAQQPLNNVVRVALQGFAAVCGGTQSLHTNGFDEALALPSERAAKLALRTQQVIAHESGATDTVDPFAGSYYVESLTAEIEQRAWALIEKIDEQGGSVEAIAFIKNEIEESAFGYHERYRIKQDIVVGVNEFVEDSAEVEEILSVDPESENAQLERLKAFKAERDQELTDKRLAGAQGRGRRHRQPAPADPPGAQGQGLGRRGVRRAARGVRRIPAGDVTGDVGRGVPARVARRETPPCRTRLLPDRLPRPGRAHGLDLDHAGRRARRRHDQRDVRLDAEQRRAEPAARPGRQPERRPPSAR